MSTQTQNSIETQQPFIANLNGFGAIQITGEDTTRFLQGQLTINAESINSDKLSLAALCNLKGRCISLFFTLKQEDKVYLLLKQETIAETLATLNKYAVFFKVELTDISQEFQIVGLSTPSEVKMLDSLSTAYWFNSTIGLMLINKKQTLDKESLDIPLLEETDWLYNLAYNRIPWLELETQNHFLPHHIDLPQLAAVDFKKGCFTGQEVIARMQYKGKLKSHLQLFISESRLEQVPLKGKITYQDKTAAEIVCVAESSGRNAILAVMKDDYLNHKNFQLSDEKTSILKLQPN